MVGLVALSESYFTGLIVLLPRNRQADSRIQPFDMHSENQVPVRNTHSSHLGDTRSQPGGYKGSRPLERRGAAEVIVLE